MDNYESPKLTVIFMQLDCAIMTGSSVFELSSLTEDTTYDNYFENLN